MTDGLTRLLEAHVRHELALWQGEMLSDTLGRIVSSLFRGCAEVKLDDVTTRAQIMGVIERYVIDLRVSGGITELTGEMSHLVFNSRATANARLDQVLTPAMYEEFADKVLALEGVRRKLIALISQSSSVSSISARLIAHGLLDWAGPLSKLGARILPWLERHVATALTRQRKHANRNLEEHLTEVLDVEHLRSVVDELWDRVGPMRLSEVFAFVSEQDVEDFVVLVYEFWLRYRKTDFFRNITRELVDFFFVKYGQETLLSLIEDMGVSESMVRGEALTFVQPILEHAARSGALERQIRARLEAFYTSPAAVQALDIPSV